MSTAPPRVAIETLRGNVQAGKVVDTRLVASARRGPIRQYLVDVDGSRFWFDAADCSVPEMYDP